MKTLSLFFFTILLIYSCQNTEKEITVSIDNKYSLTIPSFLDKANNLNEDASLQYQHLKKELYVIVIDDLKSELYRALEENDLTENYSNDIHGYTNLMLDGFELDVTILEKSDIFYTTINDLPAKLITIKGSIQGIDAYYSLACIEGKERYYQIMTWTLSSKETEHKEEMRKIIYSFNEL